MLNEGQKSLENVKIPHQINSEPNNGDNEKVADLSETHNTQTDNQCDYASQRVSPPPRKRSRKKQLMRRTCKDEQKADNQSASLLSNDHQIDTNQQNARTFNRTKIDEKTVCDQIENLTLDANKCVHPNASSYKVVKSSDERTCLQWTHKTDTNTNNQIMERIRLWKTRWFTSEEARITRRRRLSRFFYFCRVFLTHLFSTTGLCLLVISYSILGAIVFRELEYSGEDGYLKDQKELFKVNRKNCAKDLWNYTVTLNVFREDQWTDATDKRLEMFESFVIDMVKRGKHDETRNRWTFFSALLYSVTVITTIGYGNVTCQTATGKIVTMIYALIGIPIMFLCLANLGNIMAKTFRFSYRRLCCTCSCFSKRRSKRKSPKTANKESFELKNNLTDRPKEIKVNFDSNDEQKVVTSVVTSPTKPNSISQTQNSDMIVQEMEDQENDRVPAWLVLLLVIGYIMAGAVLFSIWENDWGVLNGAYFCFITLTTIGFGDLVPGFAQSDYTHSEDDQIKFTFCCIYMIVGLSLLAMSFNLVQEEIVIKCKKFAHKIGILPQNNQFDKSSHL